MIRNRIPPLLQRMLDQEVGELVVRRTEIFEPRTGCRVAYGFASEAVAVNAALRMNEIADWFGILKTRAEGKDPNCEIELQRIAKDFGGQLATGNARSGNAESACARAVAAVEQSLTSGQDNG